MNNTIEVLRVGVNMADFKMPIDPIQNATLSNAFYVNHLYANLISVNNQNEYIADLAEKFYWENQSLIIEFAENSIINAKDAEFSIKRTFINDLNDHGDLWKVICKDGESRTDCLSRIRVENNILRINVSEKNNLQLVIPILSSINYKIVPKSAFDSDDAKTAKIIDYSKTSGKFFIKNDDIYELYPNLTEFNAEDTIINTVKIIDANTYTFQDLIKNKKIDVVSRTVYMFSDQFKTFTESNWSLDKTHGIEITYLIFSNSAIQKTTAAERRFIGQVISSGMNSFIPYEGTSTNQFFQNFGQGYLSHDQIEKINNLEVSGKISNKIFLSTANPDKWTEHFKNTINLIAKKNDKSYFLTDESMRLDVYALGNDVAFETSFSQISFLYKSNIFKSLNKTADQIINEYLSKPTNAEKIEYINQLHYDVISNCYIYPIWSSPYVTAVAPGFTSHMSKYSSRTLVWKIKKN